MSKYDEEELSGWDVAFSQALAEELEKRGIGTLSFEEMPDDLYDEAKAAALEVVGPKPKDE
ncbi:hypothetical protein [Stutzerimonas nitrititolerans]|uniref:hypothetical protein n=1 Tax=Stutzerimonas nitrititolerans TaxID=2482751 RepID=UPI0028A620E9|nr:hypothetical protein [Stutzerimonas nitrititolerans]